MSPCLYHATPLHYLPRILHGGALYAQSVLAADGIAPRATARRRDRMLGLDDYVHLSLKSQTPLLADKLGKGYPHALLLFDAAVLALPGTALLPYNAKSWHSRAALAPVSDPAERAALLRRHVGTGRFPSLEVLVKYGLSLAHACEVAFVTDAERQSVAGLLAALDVPAPAPLITNPALFPLCPTYAPVTREAIDGYFDRCAAAAVLLPPPSIPFD